MTKREANQITGGLSNPDKMPGYAWGIPAKLCKTGSKLRKVEGSTCQVCYALKGRNNFPSVQAAQYRRFERLAEALASSEGKALFVEAFSKLLHGCQWFRWMDTGDLQSVEHLELICEIAEQTPSTAHWLPTREYKIVSDYLKAGGQIPDNITIRLSAHMIDGPRPENLALKHPALTVSGVSEEISTCHAQNSSPNGSCDTCRACWDRAISFVIYRKH